MKKITGNNFDSISPTEEKETPEQETKSTGIELDSPETLEIKEKIQVVKAFEKKSKVKKKKKNMKKRCACLKITLICLMFLTVLPSCSEGRDKDQKIKILTGPEEGIYHKFFNSTIDRLKNKPDALVNPGNNKYDIYSSPGSIFNLECLTRGQDHFTIAQSDVISDRVRLMGYKIQGVA